MLYEQIRYAGAIRRVYRMRHLLEQKKPPEMGTRLGYPKYSKQFYRVKAKLREEGIIGRNGRFVESPPNLHVAAMPLRVDREQIKTLGSRIPYLIFLALSKGPPRSAAYLAREFRLSRKGVHDALKRMDAAGLVKRSGSVAASEECSAGAWLAEYLEAARVWTDASGDASTLFNAIPSYVGGPHARRLLEYEPGLLLGPAAMHISTYEPFLDLLQSLVRNSRYFQKRSELVHILPAAVGQTRWVDGVPYQDDAGGVGG